MTPTPPLPSDVWDALPVEARTLIQAMRLQIQAMQLQIDALQPGADRSRPSRLHLA